MIVFQLLILVCYALMAAILVRVVFSWVSPGSQRNPLYRLSYDVTEPLLRPVRNLFPPSGLDFSPVIVLVGLQIVASLLGRFY